MVTEIEKELCLFYGLSPRKITNKQVLGILELLIRHFKEIKFLDCSFDNCNYDLYSIIETDKYRDDEEQPFCGCGWDIKDVILNQCLDEEALENFDFKEDLKYLLMNPFEKIAEILWWQKHVIRVK